MNGRLDGRDDAPHGRLGRGLQRIERDLHDVEIHTEPVRGGGGNHEQVPDCVIDRFPLGGDEEANANEIKGTAQKQEPQRFFLNLGDKRRPNH